MDAIVVGGTNLGERDRIVRLLSAEEGRSDALARGARASRRRFAGALDVGTRLTVELRRGRGRLPSIADLSIRRAPNHARRDLDRIALLAYGCELCASLAPEHHAAPELFRLCDVWLDLLEDPEPVGAASRVALEGKALTFAGLRPALATCARCGGPLDDPVVFDPEAGGGQHARCGGGTPVRAADLAMAERLRRTPLVQTRGAVWSGPPWLLSDFARYHLGRPLRSRGMLNDLRGGPC